MGLKLMREAFISPMKMLVPACMGYSLYIVLPDQFEINKG